MNLHILSLIKIICYKLNIWVLRRAGLAKMKIKWQKKNSGWSWYSTRRKQTTINQGLVSSSAQAQLHQAPVNGLENDLVYQVTCTYNIPLLNGCAARVREMREQGMMGRRERTPNANPLYPIHPSMFAYIRFSPLNDPQDAVPVSRDWSMNETSLVHFLWPYHGKKTAMVCSFLFLYKYTLLIGGHVSPQRRKKMFSGCRIPWS